MYNDLCNDSNPITLFLNQFYSLFFLSKCLFINKMCCVIFFHTIDLFLFNRGEFNLIQSNGLIFIEKLFTLSNITVFHLFSIFPFSITINCLFGKAKNKAIAFPHFTSVTFLSNYFSFIQSHYFKPIASFYPIISTFCHLFNPTNPLIFNRLQRDLSIFVN